MTEIEEPEPFNFRYLRRPGPLAAVAMFVLMAGFWAWIFNYQLQNKGEDDMLDRLDDLTWTAQAEDICQSVLDYIDDLPPAPASKTPEDRSVVIIAATDRLEEMLQSIEAIAPTDDSRDARITKLWIADYRDFLQDRYVYADLILDDIEARFVVTERYGSHITKPIDRFARVNEMEACMTPGDV